MICPYCDSIVEEQPQDGICPYCTAQMFEPMPQHLYEAIPKPPVGEYKGAKSSVMTVKTDRLIFRSKTSVINVLFEDIVGLRFYLYNAHLRFEVYYRKNRGTSSHRECAKIKFGWKKWKYLEPILDYLIHYLDHSDCIPLKFPPAPVPIYKAFNWYDYKLVISENGIRSYMKICGFRLVFYMRYTEVGEVWLEEKSGFTGGYLGVRMIGDETNAPKHWLIFKYCLSYSFYKMDPDLNILYDYLKDCGCRNSARWGPA